MVKPENHEIRRGRAGNNSLTVSTKFQIYCKFTELHVENTRACGPHNSPRNAPGRDYRRDSPRDFRHDPRRKSRARIMHWRDHTPRSQSQRERTLVPGPLDTAALRQRHTLTRELSKQRLRGAGRRKRLGDGCSAVGWCGRRGFYRGMARLDF